MNSHNQVLEMYPTCPPWGTREEKIRKIRSNDFNITKAENKLYGIDHITANVINIYYRILWCNGHIIAFKNHIRITFTE